MNTAPRVRCAGIQLRRRWVGGILASLGSAGVIVTGLVLLGMGASALLPGLVTALLWIAAAITMFSDRRRRGGEVVLGPLGLVVHSGGREIGIERAEIIAGYELPARHAVFLELAGGREAIVELAELRDPVERVLEHLGVSVQQRALTAPLRGVVGAFLMGLLTLVASGFVALSLFSALVPSAGWAFLLAMLTSAACVIGVLRRFGWPKVIIGLDGVRVTGVWSRPFVPYSQVEAVTPHADGIQIALRDGDFLQLATIGQSTEEISALTRRIQQGMTAYDRGAGKDASPLARHGRPVPVWREDLCRIALAPPGFRDQALSRDDFEKLLVDARAPAEQRIGAALALRAVDPAATTRIRVAAAASANQELRAALEACALEDADIDDAVLERATAARHRR